MQYPAFLTTLAVCVLAESTFVLSQPVTVCLKAVASIELEWHVVPVMFLVNVKYVVVIQP